MNVQDNTTFNLRTIKSNSLDIVQDTDDIFIETVSFTDIERFIVNNLYTGSEELGTLARPFRTIQAALDAFVGTGTRDNPQFDFATIVIQRGNDYNFTGNFSYRNLNVIIEENAQVNHIPAMGEYFVCLLYTSPSPRDQRGSRMPSSA